MNDSTLRDLFAAHALAGYLAAHAGDDITLPTKSDAAEYAFRQADAMMAARRPKAETETETAPAPHECSHEAAEANIA